MAENLNLENINDATVYDQDNEKVGSVKEIYLDDQTNEPRFATVSTGLFGMKETFVPLDAARQIADGDLKVPFTKDFIKDAPNIDPDGHLEPSEEREILDYYDMDFNAPAANSQSTDVPRTDAQGNDALRTDAQRTDSHPTDAAAADTSEEAVAREERLKVGKQDQVAGQVRLRKRILTDREQVEVPVEREELDEDTSAAARAGSITDTDETEETITLHEERPVVAKETVATEKVNVGKRKVTDTETVGGEVRKEEIDVEADEADRGKHGRNR